MMKVELGIETEEYGMWNEDCPQHRMSSGIDSSAQSPVHPYHVYSEYDRPFKRSPVWVSDMRG
jgi:hypothetical protein